MNKRTILLSLLILAATSFTYAQKMVLSSVWRDSVIAIDGNLADWDQPFRYFDSKSKLQYSIVNDDKYIYISVKTNDEKAEMKIMRAGMEVWFDVTGKKKDIATVRFPIRTDSKLDMTTDPMAPEQQIVERPDVKKMKVDWNESTKEVHTQGFKNVPAKWFTETDSGRYGIQVAVSWDRYDAMTYELRVPFSAFYKDSLAASDTLHPISIGIKANAMDLPMIPSNTGADVTGPAGGGMNTMSNGMSGPGGMPNTMSNNQRPQTASAQPTLAIPRGVADMGIALIVTMKLKLAYK